MKKVTLTAQEQKSGRDRIKRAEDLIIRLLEKDPGNEQAKSWLMNYGFL